MAFFAMPYRVLFHDTMAYGSHHFLTNFKFQCEIREHFFFSQVMDANPNDNDLQNLVLLTQEGYTRNFAPVLVGERVGCLLSIEEHTRSSVRMCFRVIRQDGKPVCCGFQSMVCTSRQGGVVLAPTSLLYALAPIREPLRGPSFQERVLAGGTAIKAIFDEETLRLGAAAVSDKPQLVPEPLLPPPLHARPVDVGKGIVFTFPGQGLWEPRLLRELCQLDLTAATLLAQADEITARMLGASVLALIEGKEAEAALYRCPDLVQVAGYLTSVLTSRYLIAQGVTPHLLLGHSAGELAALAVAGAVDFGAGVELVCHRVKALQSLPAPVGGMIALSCDEKRALALIDAVGEPNSLQVSVINGAEQTVVSGSNGDLQRFKTVLAARQIVGVPLKSRYPFHCELLRDAVAPFEAALGPLAFKALTIPVYSPLARGLFPVNPDLPKILSAHFLLQLNFPEAMEDAFALGGRTFIECSGGRVLTGLAQRIFRDWPGVAMHALATEGELVRIVQKYGKANGVADKKVTPEPRTVDSEVPVPLPIAIVSLGCVLPGAADATALWQNLLSGKSGIIDVAQLDATVADDFRCERPVKPDKTYSLLSGRAEAAYDEIAARHYTAAEWASLTAVGRFLAAATGQCLADLKTSLPDAQRICCVLGSTGDGSADYDELLLLSAVEESVGHTDASASAKLQFAKAMENVLSRSLTDAGERTPWRSYMAVAQRLFGVGTKVLAVDAACASSLYAIDMGMRALRDGACDVAVCGGTFAPGVANTCLFAQFQGLSATGSRPLDAGADGVVFGEGAALLVLKRLPDALAAGDNIRAIIRGVGTSSDGKSPSVMEPRKEGQVLAMRRAAARSGVPLATVQYIDAHATGTPVGDAVEFGSLREAVGQRPAGSPSIRLGSLKGLLGHTGWAAGAASVIALCKALEHQTFPPQPNFTVPNPQFAIEGSPFVIGTKATPWPANADGLPRRAGVNGFGFGGCDAHLILEEFSPTYHGTLRGAVAPAPSEVAIVAFSSLMPATREMGEHSWQFSPTEVRLPDKVRILPDVADHMDRSHILAVRAAAEVVSQLSKSWDKLRAETGILVGFAGKTRRGIDSSLRVYFDHLIRKLGEKRASVPDGDPQFDLVRDTVFAAIGRITPSGPYTLPGLMPNVMAGRVANAFHITGPNMVLDAQQTSLYQVLREGERLLRFNEARLILAAGISACAGSDVDRVLHACENHDPRPSGEAVLVLGLVLPATAKELGLPVVATLSFSNDSPCSQEKRVGTMAPYCLQGAEGSIELAHALETVQGNGGNARVTWTEPLSRTNFGLMLTGTKATAAPKVETPKDEVVPDEVASLLAVPVYWTAPKWFREPLPAFSSGHSLNALRLLVLSDQPEWSQTPAVQAALGRLTYRLVAPLQHAAKGAIGIDLSSTEAMEKTQRQLDSVPYDLILVLKNLKELDAIDSVTEPCQFSNGLLDLLFAVVRHGYGRLEKSELRIGALCLHGAASKSVHPFTGLLSGFLRSLCRELPRANCKHLNTSDDELAQALGLLEAELNADAAPGYTEASYFGRERYTSRLVALQQPATGTPLLGPDSVVVAVGGARGITAVLAEALLRKFGCTLVLLGRTDPDAAPAELLALTDEAFERFEPEFYHRELAKGQGARMPDLKRRFDNYRSAREAASTVRVLRSLPGKLKYLRADVTDEKAVDAVVQQVAAEFGRLDMVLHGAGIQSSKVLARKKLEEFRAILTTKLGGLGNLMRACRRHFPGSAIHFHPITSSFSEIGNAGQEDYGAANVAMDRIAQHLAVGSGPWTGSSLGWLGWLGVGMTRGSEYATLAIMRRLRPIPRPEGRALFEAFLSGRPVAPTLHLMSAQEAGYFQLRIKQDDAPPIALPPKTLQRTLTLSPDTHPFLRDHLLNGVATLPGAFAVELAVRTVRELRPDMHVKHLATVSIERFIKFTEGRPFILRSEANIIEEDDNSARIAMRFLSDFVHAKGQILQKDIVHFSAEFLLTAEPQAVASHGPVPAVVKGWQLPDPYLHPAGPLLMGGAFLSLHEIKIGQAHSTAIFRLGDMHALPAAEDTQLPFVLLDALWRFSAILRDEDGAAILCVPLRCGRLDVLPNVTHHTLAYMECRLTCGAPRLDGEHILVDWAEAADASGRVLFFVKDIVGRVYGRVPSQTEPFSATPAEPVRVIGYHRAASNQSPRPAFAEPKLLEGKIALVTGSGRGIGKVIALRLAELGAQVIVNSFHSRDQGEKTTAEAIARGGRAIHLWGSVANSTHLAGIFQEIDSRFGGLDFFISNASAGIFAPLKEVTPEHWDRCFRTNVTALHQGSLLASQLMRRRGGGKVIALSSVGAQLCFDYFGCVGPVKAAVECMVRYLAVELAADGIQVNAVTAGPVAGDLLDGYPARPRWERLVPRQTLISEAEVVDPVLYLLTRDGMNGASLLIDAAGSLRLCEPVS